MSSINQNSPWTSKTIAITALIPVVDFLAAYNLAPSFQTFVLAQDIRALTMLQLWRVVGFVFLPLYAFEMCPAADDARDQACARLEPSAAAESH